MKRVKVTFQTEESPNIVEEIASEGELLTQVALRAGVTIQQTCGGSPSCTDCVVKVVEGVENGLSPMESEEIALLGNVYFITKERLACQSVLKNDVTVKVPDPKTKNPQRRGKAKIGVDG